MPTNCCLNLAEVVMFMMIGGELIGVAVSRGPAGRR
jgi:hypothetical protein